MAFISPGVFLREVDLSQYAARVSTSILGLVGFAERGFPNVLTFISNESQFLNTFGRPLVADTDATYTPYNTYLAHAAIQFLRQGNQLWVVRAAADGATKITQGTSAETTHTALATLTSGGTASIRVYAGVRGFRDMGRWANVEATPPTSPTISTRGISVVTSAATNATGAPNTWFKLEVYYEGRLVETWDDVNADPTDTTDWVGVKVNDLTTGSRYIFIQDDGLSDGVPDFQTWYLTGGDNGDEDDGETSPTQLEAALLGAGGTDGSTILRTGAYHFRDVDAVDINLLAIPGAERLASVAATATNVLADVTEVRQDCFQLMDTDSGLTPQGAKDWANGDGNYSDESPINSSYAGIFWPWVEYFDTYNAVNVWTPPCGWVAGQMAFNDRVADPWFAAAGFTRGKISGANRIEYSTSQGERELLYAPGQVINPIVNFQPDGLTIWGNKTTQRISSALDRINVRRMLLFAEKIIASAVRVLVFEPNDPATWRRFVGIVQPVLESIRARRGLVDFRVICDASTNTTDRLDRNEMYGILLLRLTKTAEIITIDFTLVAQGATFTEAQAS